MPEGASATAVLLMAHGTPESVDQMAEYLRLVRGGREPSAELIEEMTHNWEAIGGRSPLTEITQQQGEALQAQLAAEGLDVPVFVGMRNWRPFIADAMRAIAGTHARRILGIPLAPQFSTLSVQKYMDAAKASLPNGVEFSCVRSFHDHPLLIEAFAEKVRAAQPRPGEDIVFTAHSLPQRVASSGDPYPNEVAATAKAIAERCGIGSYHTAYQSAGRTPEPWLGPDLSDHVRQRAAAGVRSMLVVPIGFVCDHTEILFDIDVQAAAAAREAGVALRRTESLNTSPTFITALAGLVVDSLKSTVDSHE
ncbi:MAG TPA: ferrochelatase [Vicinamibacterales bacterium]|nr:ferrochelatase [Vicinamibacterales bacterium]